MLIDAQAQLSSAQALTATALSTNAYDLGAPYSGGSANGAAIDPSVGEPLAVVISVGVAADTASTDETYKFDVVQSANANLSSSDTLIEAPFTNALAAANLTAGAVIVVPIPPGSITKRYLGVNYVLAGTTPSITVTSWIAPLSMIQKQRYYASATVIN